MKTALMFAHECAPYNRLASTIGAQRPAQFAKYLPEFGWRLIVVCCDTNLVRTANKGDIRSIAIEAVKFLDSGEINNSVIIPTPSLKYSSFIDKIWYSLVEKKQDGSFESKKSRFAFLRKPLTFLKLYTGDYSESWQPVALEVANKIAEKIKIDICIAEHGPDASLFLAHSFAEKLGIPWIVDFRDPILRPFKNKKRELYRDISKKIVATAKAIINATPVWAALDAQHFGLPSFTITNGFDKEEFAITVENEHKHFVISYLGSINYIQDVDLFLRSLKVLKQKLNNTDRGLVKFIYRGGKYEEINIKSKNLEISEMVDSVKNIPRNDAINLMKASDLLLLFASYTHARTKSQKKTTQAPRKESRKFIIIIINYKY